MPEYLKELPDGYICRPKDFDPGRLMGRAFIIEEKLDGEHVLFRPAEMYGRRPDERGVHVNRWAMLPQRIRDLVFIAEKDLHARLDEHGFDGWVEGELYVEGGTSTDLKHDLLENGGRRTRLRAFRIPSVEGELPPSRQRMELENAGLSVPRVLTWNPDVEDFNAFDVTHYANAFPHSKRWILDNIERIKTLAEAKGYEGWIIWRDSLSSYHMPLLWKLKLEYTYDLVATGITPAKAGKYHGGCGSLRGSWYRDGELIEVATCSGMNDETRAAITESDMGRAFEVTCKGFGSRGRLRHPQFERWRDDKPNEDCLAPEDWARRYGVRDREEAI